MEVRNSLIRENWECRGSIAEVHHRGKYHEQGKNLTQGSHWGSQWSNIWKVPRKALRWRWQKTPSSKSNGNTMKSEDSGSFCNDHWRNWESPRLEIEPPWLDEVHRVREDVASQKHHILKNIQFSSNRGGNPWARTSPRHRNLLLSGPGNFNSFKYEKLKSNTHRIFREIL